MLWPTSAILAASTLSTSVVNGIRLHGRDINAQLLDSYDYVVVGCGISGLVVTNRLSEISSRTVLCIEAGDADNYEAIIQDPVYVGSDVGGIYDWDLVTVPQTQLDGATRPMPQGKVLGGGSILNAMCWNRGGADDYDAWEALGNPGWGWEGMLPYFMKSETYTPVYSEEVAEEYSIHYNPAVHGTSGPVQVSYPKFFYPQSVNLFAGMNFLGLQTQFDPNDGTSAGPAFVPTDLDPNNQTRSDARRTYYDPYVRRSNFHVITGQHVTRILTAGVNGNNAVSNPTPGGNDNGNGPSSGNNDGFGFGPGGSTPPLSGTPPRFKRRQDPGSSNLRITGVEAKFATDASAPRRTVYATREVIVAAGALHSAQLLQLSGFGPSALLNQFKIPIALDLPGVGNNLQDHCLVGTFYPYNNASYPSPTELTTNATYNTEAEREYENDKTGPWTAGSPNALAFNPLPLISNNSATILGNASNQDATEYLVAGLDPTIVAGYTAQKQSLTTRLARITTASYEIINNNAGSLTVAVMHPFSRGTCYIQSSDPFEPPAIDPRWLTNPVDRQVLIEALLFNRQILSTPPMLELQAAQFVPPVDANEDAINQVINNGIRTEFHPSGTLAMLPLEQGGVVDSHLRVWGTQNLRVVDAGIFPMIPAAHLQAVVYGVAEKAADIVKADNLPASTAPTSTSTPIVNSTASSALAASSIVSSTPAASSRQAPPLNSTVTLQAGLSAGSLTSSQATQNVSSVIGLAASVSTDASIAVSTSISTLSSALQAADSSIGPLPTPTQLSSTSEALMVTDVQSSQILQTFTASADLSIGSVLPSSSTRDGILTTANSVQATAAISSAPAMLSRSSSLDLPTSVTASPSLPGPEEMSSSIGRALMSAGMPSSIVATLMPIIIGSTPASTLRTTASSLNAESQQEQRMAAIEAFLQWISSFFT